MFDRALLWFLDHLPIVCFVVVFALFVALIVVQSRNQDTIPRTGGTHCRSWVADCALHRTLTECRVDARALGCKGEL